jgi:hypothetical protein
MRMIQEDLGDVLLDALDGGVFVQYPFDLHFGDGAAGHGGKQHAPQRVAQSVAESPVQGLDDDLRRVGSDLPDVDDTGGE